MEEEVVEEVEDATVVEEVEEAEDEEDFLQGMWISEVQMCSVFLLSLTDKFHLIAKFIYLIA